MKRNFFHFVLFALCFLTMLASFSFAQNTGDSLCGEDPEICSAPSKEFGYYNDFVLEMLQAINTTQGKGDEIGEYNYIGGLFTNKLLEIPGENKNILSKMLAGIEESISRSFSSAKGILYLLSSLTLTSYKDVLGLSILFQSRPIVREWKTLLDLETDINDKFYELSLSAMAGEELLNYNKFQEIINKYTDSFPLFSAGSVTENTKYKDIMNMLIRLNGAMKTFVPYGKISQFYEFSKGGEGGIYLKFNTGTISDMKQAYKCGRGYSKCTSSRKDFVENTKIRSNLKKGGKDASKTIVDANKRLAESIKGIKQAKPLKKSAGEGYLTDREIELLRDIYGIDTSKLTKQEGISFRDILSKINKETFSDIKEQTKYLGDLSKNAIKNANEEIKETKQNIINSYNTWDQLRQNSKKIEGSMDDDFKDDIVVDVVLETALNDAMNIINNQQKNDLSVLVSTNSVEYLNIYTQIGKNIRDIIEIVGNKDKNIVKNLGNVCELQCSNKGTNGCYAN